MHLTLLCSNSLLDNILLLHHFGCVILSTIDKTNSVIRMLMWSLCTYRCQNLEGIFGTSKNRKVLTNFQRFCYGHVLLVALSSYHINYLITISLLQSLQGWFLGLSNLLAVSISSLYYLTGLIFLLAILFQSFLFGFYLYLGNLYLQLSLSGLLTLH